MNINGTQSDNPNECTGCDVISPVVRSVFLCPVKENVSGSSTPTRWHHHFYQSVCDQNNILVNIYSERVRLWIVVPLRMWRGQEFCRWCFPDSRLLSQTRVQAHVIHNILCRCCWRGRLVVVIWGHLFFCLINSVSDMMSVSKTAQSLRKYFNILKAARHKELFSRRPVRFVNTFCTLEWRWKWYGIHFPLPPSAHWTAGAGSRLSVGDCSPGQIQVFP